MRTGKHGGAQAGRLERILAAVLDQAAAEKSKLRGAIEQSELAQRIGDVDFSGRFGQRVRGATLDGELQIGGHALDVRTTKRVARHDDGERTGGWRAQILRRFEDLFLLAGVRCCGQNYRPWSER